MKGKIIVTTPNPPCKGCGGMGGYHRKGCKASRKSRK